MVDQVMAESGRRRFSSDEEVEDGSSDGSDASDGEDSNLASPVSRNFTLNWNWNQLHLNSTGGQHINGQVQSTQLLIVFGTQFTADGQRPVDAAAADSAAAAQPTPPLGRRRHQRREPAHHWCWFLWQFHQGIFKFVNIYQLQAKSPRWDSWLLNWK